MKLLRHSQFQKLQLTAGLAMVLSISACGELQNKNADQSNSSDENIDVEFDGFATQLEEGQDPGFSLSSISNFYNEPTTCDAYHSEEYYCDGYTQRNVPLAPNGANPTAETHSSTTPSANYVGLQVIGSFKSTRPSVVYIHGWNVEGTDRVFSFPDQWAEQANKAGYNVLFYHWAKYSYDNGAGCPGLGWFGVGNIPCNAAHALYKKGGAGDMYIAAYKSRFKNYNQNVRVVAQSLGTQLALYTTYRMYKRTDMAGIRLPNRVDLIDPFMTPGFGGNRNKPYDGQIPSDSDLPTEFKNNLVTSFVQGSSCHNNWNPLAPNHKSQYCQNEGMAWKLVKDHNVGIIDFSSAVGGASAQNFRKAVLFQALSSKAFKSNLTARHVTPNASYFYSFKPGEPSNGYDASSSDATILTDSRKQAVNRTNMAKIQTSGFDTITFMDDNYKSN